MTINTALTCPLGSKCEEIRDNSLHRCRWYIELSGTNPNTGEPINDHDCAMAWVPILLIENSRQQRSTSAAVESFRNEMVQAQEANQQLFMASQTVALPVKRSNMVEHPPNLVIDNPQ